MRIPTEILIAKYQHHLFRAAFSVCKNAEDAEDAVQDTFLKYHTTEKEFESEQHIRAWLLRVVINLAKKHKKQRRALCLPLQAFMHFSKCGGRTVPGSGKFPIFPAACPE